MGTRLDVPHMKLMVAIADTGGVTAAARRLFVTQSALSHRLRTLEQTLGIALFRRTKGRLVLTEAGDRLVAASRRILADVEAVEREIRLSDPEDRRGVVRVTTECYTCYHWLPSVLTAYRRKWPHVDFALVPEATARPLAAVLGGTVDVAIVHGHEALSRVSYHPLFEDELMLVLPRNHALSGRTFVTAVDFAELHLFLYQSAGGDTTVERELLRPAAVVPAQVTRLQLTEAILEMVKAGLGATVMARWAVAPLVNAGEVIALRVTKGGLPRRWSAAVLADVQLAPHVADFVSYLSLDAFEGSAAARLTLTA